MRSGAERVAPLRIRIVVADQTLELFDDQDALIRRYIVSTALNGVGEESGSYCTPRGSHIIRAKIGAGQPVNSVFVKRRPTGEVYTPELGAQSPGRDWILTRILWLSGCEPGRNRLGSVDTMRRYIYIHGRRMERRWACLPRKAACGCKMKIFWTCLTGWLIGIPVEIVEAA